MTRLWSWLRRVFGRRPMPVAIHWEGLRPGETPLVKIVYRADDPQLHRLPWWQERPRGKQ